MRGMAGFYRTKASSVTRTVVGRELPSCTFLQPAVDRSVLAARTLIMLATFSLGAYIDDNLEFHTGGAYLTDEEFPECAPPPTSALLLFR